MEFKPAPLDGEAAAESASAPAHRYAQPRGWPAPLSELSRARSD
jgi:hypothetical protein